MEPGGELAKKLTGIGNVGFAGGRMFGEMESIFHQPGNKEI